MANVKHAGRDRMQSDLSDAHEASDALHLPDAVFFLLMPSSRLSTRLISLYPIPSSPVADLLDVPAKAFLTSFSIFS